jgi:hypothetical protein
MPYQSVNPFTGELLRRFDQLTDAQMEHRIVHHNVTAHPTAEWTLQQFREALPEITHTDI